MDELVSRIAELNNLMETHQKGYRELVAEMKYKRVPLMDLELSIIAWTGIERIALLQIYECASKIAADHEQ